MLILFRKAEQLGLFDAPVLISGSVRKDGAVIPAHVQIRKIRQKPIARPQRRATAAPASAEPSGILQDPIPAAPIASAPVESHVQGGSEAIGSHEPGEAGSTPATATPPHAPFGVPAGTSKAKRREINAQVVAALDAPDPDAALLRQYSGYGGCGDSLNEFYTDPQVAAAMWSVIERLGAPDGPVLEPSCATGVFLHTAPAGRRVVGVELDPISAKVAQVLHGAQHEIQTASLERFATTDDRQFAIVIGNPPYGPRGWLLKDDKKDLGTAEQYFVDTALDKALPSGIVALVVPTGILDSQSGRSFRERMLTKAEFLGAQRMPNTAFEAAHTEVTTDVIYLRKRPDDVAGALGTVPQPVLQKLGVWDDEFLSGGYYAGRGAEHVLGTQEAGWRAKAGMGDDITVTGSMADVPARLVAFEPHSVGATPDMGQILASLGDDEAARERARSAAFRRPYADAAKPGDTRVIDGVTYVLQGDPARWHRVDEFLARESIAEGIEIGEQIQRLLDGEPVDRAAVEARVRNFVARFGVPAADPELVTAAAVDKVLYRLIGAVTRDGEVSDLVAGRLPEAPQAGTLDATAQAIALARPSGDFTPTELAEKLVRDETEVIDLLTADDRYAWAGGDRWAPMDLYLTGELWPKLDAARAALASPPDGMAAKLRLQVERLEAAIAPKSLEDVEFQLNSGFLPLDVVADYFNWRMNDGPVANKWTREQPPIGISFDGAVFKVEGGGDHQSFPRLLDQYLNRTGVRKDDLPTIDAWNEEFREWLCASKHRERVEDLYNRAFRGFVARQYSNEPIEAPGLTVDKTVRDWRWSSLRRSLADGKGIIADDVGLGKTLGGLLLARMAKMDGRAKRPIIVVPKSVLGKWFAETLQWFPDAKVLTIGASFERKEDGTLAGKDDEATERKRKYHEMQQTDFDFILISEPAFEEIDLDPITKEKYYSEDFWVQRGDQLGNAGDKRRKKIRENYEQALAKREFEDRTDAVNFNDLGCDMLIADEMHHQKNLYAARARHGEAPKFLGGQGLSNRALDFTLKARWVREQNGGKNVYGLTATPTKNSPLEIYSMLSHIAPEEFQRIGIRNSEEFLDRFCEFQRDKVLGTNGAIEDALVVAGFKNIGELREIMDRYIDRRTAEMVGLKLPDRQDEMHLVDMSPEQHAVYEALRVAAEKAARKKDATGDAHIFSIMDKMNKAAIDLELLDPGAYKAAASPKYAGLAEQVKRGIGDGGQVIFSEFIGTHEKIAAALVASGVKRSEIGIINADVAGSAVKRQNIAEAFNAGKLKVVIGNCTMSEGVDLQKRTSDLHHMDLPWEPASVQQRNGRGLRQGNELASMRIHTYLSKGSFDGYRYQSIRAKKDWMDLLYSGADRIENLSREGGFSLDDMRIMLAANPDEARAAFEADKKAALQRHAAGERTRANGEFVRFQTLRRSLNALPNKETASAARLRARFEHARQTLHANPFFTAKDALESNVDVLIEPQTGAELRSGVGIDVDGHGKHVVDAVNLSAGTVTMRRYMGGERVTVPVSDLAHGVTLYTYTPEAEAADAAKEFAAEASGRVASLQHMEDVRKLPSAVIEANHDRIQQRLKEVAASYQWSPGDQVMVQRETGKLEALRSYDVRAKGATHDFLLPTEANRERALQAWLESRRGARIGTKFVESSRRGRGANNRPGKTKPAREYPDAPFSERHENPFTRTLRELSGEQRWGVKSPLEREAHARLEKEQLQRMRDAETMPDVMGALMPLGTIESEGEHSKVTYPRKALAIAWAKGRHLGALETHVAAHGPRDRAHASYAYGGSSDRSTHAALVAMAGVSGHHDLAAAMDEAAVRHGAEPSAKETMGVLASGFGQDRRTLLRVLAAAERAGLADTPITQLPQGSASAGILERNTYAYGYQTPQTVREKIAKLLETAP